MQRDIDAARHRHVEALAALAAASVKVPPVPWLTAGLLEQVAPLADVARAATEQIADSLMAFRPYPSFAHVQSSVTGESMMRAIAGATRDWAQDLLVPWAHEVSDALSGILKAQLAGIDRKAWAGLAGALERYRRRWLPPNLVGFDELTAVDLERLADEGLTLWAVPRESVARRLVQAQSQDARRRVLSDRWEAIVEDCASVAAASTGGPYADQARLLEHALNAIRGGHVEAAQALLASVLDGTRKRFTSGSPLQSRLINHRDRNQLMDHFAALEAADAMVWRPIWFAYRPQTTPEERAASPAFARHAAAHGTSLRHFNRRNAVQAAMLAASLIDFATLRHRQVERIEQAS